MNIDGGPAFAAIATSPSDDVFHQTGMTLRDYFAAAALTGFTAGAFWAEVENDEAAKAAYAVADAMIAARAAIIKAQGQEVAPDGRATSVNGDDR
jgi:hypothetical protein